MAVHIRLIQIEMYLPDVQSETDVQRALSALKRYCKNQVNIALTIEPFSDVDRGGFSITVIGTDKHAVEQESDHLITWIETEIAGQSLETEVSWL